jgi:hypothetical protein
MLCSTPRRARPAERKHGLDRIERIVALLDATTSDVL